MTEEQQYLNTFAIISFEKNNEKSSVQYEIFSKRGLAIDNSSNAETSIEDQSSAEIEEIDVRYWLMKKDNSKTYYVVSAQFISDDAIDDVFAGPFEDLDQLDLFSKYNNLQTDRIR